MRVVVIGKSGQVARGLQRAAAERGIDLRALARSEFDLQNPSETRIVDLRPDVVINAGAYTNVDKAESEPELVFAINAHGAEAAARAATKSGAAFIQLSTDYVFSGEKPASYVETDPTGPINVYGASKLAGEEAVRVAAPRSVILRTSWVYDAQGANFIRAMLRRAQSDAQVRVVCDQHGRPTFGVDLAHAILSIAKLLNDDAAPSGTYHCAGGGDTTWADFAREAFRVSRAQGGPAADVVAIATADYPTPAKRPFNSRLDCSKLECDYNVKLRAWTEALADCLREIATRGWSV